MRVREEGESNGTETKMVTVPGEGWHLRNTFWSLMQRHVRSRLPGEGIKTLIKWGYCSQGFGVPVSLGGAEIVYGSR